MARGSRERSGGDVLHKAGGRARPAPSPQLPCLRSKLVHQGLCWRQKYGNRILCAAYDGPDAVGRDEGLAAAGSSALMGANLNKTSLPCKCQLGLFHHMPAGGRHDQRRGPGVDHIQHLCRPGWGDC